MTMAQALATYRVPRDFAAPVAVDSGVVYSRVHSMQDLLPRRTEWNALVDRCPASTVNQTFEWLASWWKVFGQDGEGLILLAERDGQLVGAAPLMLTERPILGRTRRVIQFIGAGASDYLDVIHDPNVRGVVRGLFAHLLGLDLDWDMVYLTDIPASSPTLSRVPYLCRQRKLPWLIRDLWTAPVYRSGDPVTDHNVQSLRTPKRHHNWFMRAGSLNARVHTEIDETLSCLDQYFAQHAKRWAATDTPSEYLDEKHREFLREVVRSMAPKGTVRLWSLELDEDPVAYMIALEYRGSVLSYRVCYDLDYGKRSPFHVLLRYILKDLRDRSVGTLDFGTGDEGYKMHYSNSSRQTFELRCYRGRASRQVDGALLASRERLLPLVRRSPVLRPLGVLLMRWQKGLLD